MNINNEAITILAKEVKKMIKVIVDKSKLDRTVKGRIIAIPDETNNQYTVVIKGNEYKAVSCINGLSINDIVYITIAENNYNDLIILTKIK